jgi:hypothetical protein
MVTELMNEAERFLLKHWDECRQLEASMDGVRTKYKATFQKIVESVTEARPELDHSVAYVTQFWGSGSIGFARKSWVDGDSDWPPGLWIESLRLENLTAEDAEPPYAFIWISAKSARKCQLDVELAKKQLTVAAKELLSADEFGEIEEGDSNEVLLYLPSPSKAELLNLIADGDGQGFVKRFVAQFELMAKFVPALDKLFRGTTQDPLQQFFSPLRVSQHLRFRMRTLRQNDPFKYRSEDRTFKPH